ncbi:hypothetical protein [Sanguibacter antarcticus]|uniref:Uncharacterized protein n=1 Tax=Sanguibacter antarcticus TaxID=372484 RepID=A0A2A9E6X8_9MICO|nr:hypothetical protein [Sanguibacter antarcticus]PFG34817.1 hypothetical protein ATL42_2744 [Sanguibacter antarcticus]
MSGATVPFLRRRPPHKPTPSAEVSSAPALALHQPEPGPESTLRTLPRVRGAGRLEPHAPMVVLDRRQSSIGSLRVLVDPAPDWAGVLWELADGRSGPLDDVPLDDGRRPYVSRGSAGTATSYDVGLRHLRAFRRIIIGVPSTSVISIELVGGTRIVCAPGTTALALYQHDGELYLRADSEPYPSQGHLRAEYGM